MALNTYPLVRSFALSALLLATPVAAEMSAIDYYESALKHYADGDTRSAYIQLKNALKLDNDYPPARLLLAKTYLDANLGAVAEEELKRAEILGADPHLVIEPLAKAYFQQGKFKVIIDRIRPDSYPFHLRIPLLSIRAEAYLERQDYPNALKTLDEILLEEPFNTRALMNKARIHLGRARWDLADDMATRVLEFDKRHADAWFVKAEIQRHKGNFEKAVAHYDMAILQRDKYVSARLARASILLELEQDQRAAEDVARVQEIQKDHPGAAYLRALLQVRSGDMAGAAKTIQAASETLQKRDPDSIFSDTAALLLAGVINYAQQKYKEASVYLTKYVALMPEHAESRKLLGGIRIREGENEAALSILQPALRQTPDDPQLHALLGTAYLRLEQTALARRHFDKVLQVHPDSAAMQRQTALSSLIRNQINDAVSDFEAALDKDPESVQARVMLTLTLMNQERLEEARLSAEKFLKTRRNDAFAHNLLAAVLMRIGDNSIARAHLNKAIALAPDNLAAHFNLIELDSNENKLKSAKKRLNKLFKQNDKDPRIMLQQAWLSERMGDDNEAIRWLERARSHNRSGSKASQDLIRLYFKIGDDAKALETANELADRFANNADILETVVHAQIQAKRVNYARETLLRLVDMNKHSAPDLIRLAKLQLKARDFTGARTTLEQAVLAADDYDPAHVALVGLRLHLGHLDQAKSHAEVLKYGQPKRALGYRLLGEVLLKKKQYQDAWEELEQAYAIKPDEATVILMHRTLVKSGEYKDGLKLLADWDAKHPNSKPVLRAMASSYSRLGKLDEAIRLYERLLKDQEKDASINNNLASLYSRRNDFGVAKKYAEQAKASAPNHPAILDTLAWIEFNLGNSETALNLLRNAQIRAGRNATLSYHLGAVLASMGDVESAREELNKAIALMPDYLEAAELLKRLP